MMNQMTGRDAGPDARLKTMRILWAALLLNVGLFVLVAYFGGAQPGERAEDTPPLLYVLAAAGVAGVAASFPLKASFYRRAAGRQEPALLQTGLILAMVLSESAALLGVVAVFATRCDQAYLLFPLGALGMALHFPRREQVAAAYYRQAG